MAIRPKRCCPSSTGDASETIDSSLCCNTRECIRIEMVLKIMGNSVCYRNNRVRWTIRDLTFLENNYSSMSVVEIADGLGWTPGAVGLMADKLGCRKKKNAPWSENEMDIIRDHYARGMEARSLTQLLPGRSISAIFSMAEALGVKSGRFWREEELDILKADYPRMGMSVTAHLPERNAMSVKIMARRQGLKKSRCSEAGFRPWSDEEWTLLEKNMHPDVAEQPVLQRLRLGSLSEGVV